MTSRSTLILIIGAMVSAPLLVLGELGLFADAAQWLSLRLPRLLVLPPGELATSLPLQYALHTALAYCGAALGMSLEATWKKYLFLLGLTFLLLLLSPVLALNGLLFEPFSGILAAAAAMLLAVLISEIMAGSSSTTRHDLEAALPAQPDQAASPKSTDTKAEGQPIRQEEPAPKAPQIVPKGSSTSRDSQEVQPP